MADFGDQMIPGVRLMVRPRRIDMELVTQAQVVVADANDVESLCCAQAVLLPALLGATLEQTAMLLGGGTGQRSKTAGAPTATLFRARRCAFKSGRSTTCLA